MKDTAKKELRRLREIISKERIAFTNMCDLRITQAGFDARAKDYTNEIMSRPDKIDQINSMNNFYLENLKELLQDQEISWLDVGCADGIRTKLFFDHLGVICDINKFGALDYSKEMVRQAQKVLGEGRVSWGDVTNLLYANELDLITCIYGVLGHLPEECIPTAFENLHKSLKEGGYLCTDFFIKDFKRLEKRGYNETNGNFGNYMAYFGRVKGKLVMNGTDEPLIFTQRMFSPEEIQNYIGEVGFKVIAEQKICGSNEGKYQSKVDMEQTFVLQK